MIKLISHDGNYSALVLTTLFIVFIPSLAIHSSVITAIYALLCIWALFGPRQAIQALSINYVILLLNPDFFHLPGEMGILRWLILFIVGLRVLPASSSKAFRYILPLVLFFLVVTALSTIASPQFLVSFLKIAIFSFFAATVLTAYASISDQEREKLKVWFLSLTYAVLLLSLPTLILGAAYKGKGFQGILTHPQTFGTFMAPPASYLFSSLLLKKDSGFSRQWALGIIFLALIVLSRARTGMLSFLLGLAAAMGFSLISSRSEALQLAPATKLLKIAASMAFLIILLATSSAASKTVAGFWLKGDEGKNIGIGQAFYNSRGTGMAWQWQQFLEHPVTGNGFGVYPGDYIPKDAATFMGIPISSPTEKGFLPVAVLEEIGLVGLAFLLPLALIIVFGILGQNDIGLIAMGISTLLINIGEAVFFSPGFLGGYFWLLIGLCSARGEE